MCARLGTYPGKTQEGPVSPLAVKGKVEVQTASQETESPSAKAERYIG